MAWMCSIRNDCLVASVAAHSARLEPDSLAANVAEGARCARGSGSAVFLLWWLSASIFAGRVDSGIVHVCPAGFRGQLVPRVYREQRLLWPEPSSTALVETMSRHRQWWLGCCSRRVWLGSVAASHVDTPKSVALPNARGCLPRPSQDGLTSIVTSSHLLCSLFSPSGSRGFNLPY